MRSWCSTEEGLEMHIGLDFSRSLDLFSCFRRRRGFLKVPKSNSSNCKERFFFVIQRSKLFLLPRTRQNN